MEKALKILVFAAMVLPFHAAIADEYAVGDMGGVFNVSESGAATYTLPFDLPEGINGMVPSLGLVYNSQSGNGVAGMGVSIYGTSVITRTAKDIYHDVWARGIQYAGDEDDAYSIDGQRLIQIAQNDYRLETSPNDYFVRVGSKTNMTFKAILQNGNIAYYEYKATATVPYAWYLTKVEDPFGNLITYSYTTDDDCVYLQKVEYGTNNKQSSGLNNIVTFEYESRSDAMSYIVNGNSCSMQSRLKTVTIKTNSTERNKYTLTYSNSDAFSRLTKIEESYGSTKLPPVTLGWSKIPSFSMSESTLGPTAPPTILYINDALKTLKAGDGSELTFDKGINVIGDVNGDGKDDMIFFAAIRVYDYNDSYAYSYSVNNIAFKYLSTVSTTGKTILNFSDYSILPPDVSIEFAKKKIENGTYGMFMQDFDGDGRNDVIIPSKAQSNGKSAVYFYIIGKPNISPINVLQNTNEMPLYTTSDFNNNGKADILYLENKAKDGLYVCGLFEYANSESNSFNSASLKLQNTPEKVFSSDFNGDGMSDLIVLYKTGYTIYWNMGVSKGFPFSDSNKTNGSNLTDAKVVQMGDFNGDGLMDFVINSNCSWFDLYINTGKKSIINNAIFFKVEGYYKMETSNVKYDDKTTFNCNVIDLNNDGKQDLVVNTAKYSSGFKNTYTYWFANGSTPTKTASSKKADDGKEGRFAIGDFDGDGYAELINYGYDCYNSTNANVSSTWHIYRNPSISANTNKVTYISNGPMNTDITISYSTLTNSSVYSKGSSYSYPLVNLQVPLNVVRQTYQQMAYNFYTTNYKYSGLRAHLQGRGLLGFTTIEANNTTTGEVRKTSIDNWNTTYYAPSKITNTITLGGKTNKTETTISYVSKYSKVYFAQPTTIKQTDIYGNITTTTNTYNSNAGYLTKQRTEYGGASMYKQTEYQSYKAFGGAYRPQTILVTQKHKDDANAFSVKTTYTYTDEGKPKKMVENAATVPLTHEYTYDNFGNTLTHKISGSGVTTVTTTFTYDATHRFVATEKSSANSVIASYSYNNLGRLTKKQEGISGSLLTTAYTYDAIGNITQITYPDNTKTTYTRGWGDRYPDRAYYITATTTAQAPITTWYDNLGREKEVLTKGEKNINLANYTYYDEKTGKISSVKNVVGNITLTDIYTYNSLGQLTKIAYGNGQSVDYSYDRFSVTANYGGGRILQQKYDLWGNLTGVSHNSCTSTDYKYSSCGQPLSIRYADASYQDYMVSTMTYDSRGQQTTLTDVDAGKTTYEYDALGRVTKQTDARGNVTTNTYNASGLLTRQVCGGVTTEYDYYNDLRLKQEKTGNQIIDYEYVGDLNRIEKKTYTIDGVKLEFSYVYNSNGQVTQKTYPDNMTETYTYDGNGNLATIKIGNQRVWERDSYTGTQRRWALGPQPLYVTRKYSDKGLLTEQEIIRQAGSLLKMTYTYNTATGNLTQRTGMNGTENFTYDNFDRLTTGTSYALNGNIGNKTGIGRYTYDATKKHAVVQVENSGNLIPKENVEITYNAFNKVETVTKGSAKLTITYGPNRQRTKTELIYNSTTTTTLYADNYEQRTKNGTTTTYHYVASPDGLVAVYIKPKSATKGEMYYIETDHLGSIVRAYDFYGDTKFSATYDAWGNQTISTNAISLSRGYTGHEHWNQFGLIDMNGRFYDPLLGRFLSPDPYVQAPENPQNFNRYSYCLNNPLKYTDPSGESIIGACLIVGAMAYMGGVEANFMTANNPLNPADWNWKSASTYTGIVSGAMNGAGMVGYNIAILPKIDGILTRGATMSTANVLLNGVGNKLQGNEFLYNWQGAALSGFINGAISGYMLAQENGTNLWWGNEIKYGRSKWSFFTSELPYAEVKWNIKDASKNTNDCVVASIVEADNYLGGKSSYDNVAAEVGYVNGEGTYSNKSKYEKTIRRHFSYDPIEQNDLNLNNVKQISETGGMINVLMPHSSTPLHSDNIRSLSYYKSGDVRIRLRIGSYKISSTNNWYFYLLNGLK